MSNPASSTGRYEDYPHDKRIIIYPVYLDSKASLADGRRIAVEHAAESPTLQEIAEVLEHLGYTPALEDKRYPRNALARGRVRVNLKDAATGELTVPGIGSRKALLIRLGSSIPKLKSRLEPKPKGAAAPGGMGPMAGAMLPAGLAPPAGMPAMRPPGMPPGMLPPGMQMPPNMAGMLPPGMAGLLPPGMQLPPGMAGMMPPGMMPQPGPGEGKAKGSKKKNRK
eukprot:CAMPEP_0202737520 /NCGR_PEP_ID=MMETSP1388-20130828/1605_1 /ASSEMBLY_ACC=CAM_ASM_000864 /TAXON_ID=37098 /ORGANISM="Isochrysis sp, Strain CCMP1244" /LENGTH=223 /DNA_ID=CAMNT_0049404071 /DNA_START=81 /DNA_END=752 /DNA_ORIENTATION=+